MTPEQAAELIEQLVEIDKSLSIIGFLLLCLMFVVGCKR